MRPVVVPVTLAIGCSQDGCLVEPVILSIVNGASFIPVGHLGPSCPFSV